MSKEITTFCWEEDFLSDRSTLTKDNGVKIGYVEPVGGSWQVVYGSDTIAIRPDKASAQSCLNRYFAQVIK